MSEEEALAGGRLKERDMSIGSNELTIFVQKEGSRGPVGMAAKYIPKKLAALRASRRYHSSIGRRAYWKLGRIAGDLYVAELYKKTTSTEAKREMKRKRWRYLFTDVDLTAFANAHEKWFAEQYEAGHFEPLLPPRLQKKSTREKAAAAMAVADAQRGHSIGDLPPKHPTRPRKMVRPHPAARKTGDAGRPCEKCGSTHTQSSHDSHARAPKKGPKAGKAGGYKKRREQAAKKGR